MFRNLHKMWQRTCIIITMVLSADGSFYILSIYFLFFSLQKHHIPRVIVRLK